MVYGNYDFFLLTGKTNQAKLTIMRRSYLIFLFLIPTFVTAQDFIMQAGSQKTLTPDERTLSLKKFVLGDNVTIYIPAAMDGWTVTASDVSIGNNVKIIATGNAGNAGFRGPFAAGVTDCMKGMDGRSGGSGLNGSPGKNVSLNLKISSIGSLSYNRERNQWRNGRKWWQRGKWRKVYLYL